ncbi:DUF6746 family protein [Kangiella sediminilitoris]|uniref:Uncharacterized protein n=1 Tax=Kangiella sediminilitoris TaxID=1144748 RepID=A0A1B3BDF4_9GAMM|nr:DUF6746 family protein [Kangiella sediminilitoris]AOE50859.1 hypothetical protein KS2013_2154 [Kangiella sediminilitoris]
MKLIKFVITLAVLFAASQVNAAEVRHYKGEDVNTVEEAIKVLQTYNSQLEALLKAEELKPQDMAKIHQMTYSMENALKILEGHLNITQRNLEELHLSSERMEMDKAKVYGQLYLDGVSFYTEQ